MLKATKALCLGSLVLSLSGCIKKSFSMDINNDQHPDLVGITTDGQQSHIFIQLQNGKDLSGKGTYGEKVIVHSQEYITKAKETDCNHDGIKDISYVTSVPIYVPQVEIPLSFDSTWCLPFTHDGKPQQPYHLSTK